MATIPDPTEDLDDRRLQEAPPASAPAQNASPSARPQGHVGGHTVQDWEQPAQGFARPRSAAANPVEEDPKAPEASTQEDLIVDPSPPTTALYLRPVAASAARVAATPPAPEPVPFDAKVQTLTAQSAALVDAITRGLADSLAIQLRPAVASTIDQLIPMLLSLGNTPDAADPDPDTGATAEAGAATADLGSVDTDESSEAPTAA